MRGMSTPGPEVGVVASGKNFNPGEGRGIGHHT